MCRALKLKTGTSPVKEKFSESRYFRNIMITPSFPIRAERLFETNQLNNLKIVLMKNILPPWIIKRPKICDSLYNLPKKILCSPDELRQYTLKHLAKHNDKIPIYTDGSKSENGVGFAVVGNDFKIQSSLPSFASVYTAELYAIKYALLGIESRHLTDVIIYSDSRSAIEAITSYHPRNALVANIQYLLNKLIDKRMSIVLCWIPAHIGLQGNEKADKAAKEAVTFPKLVEHLPIEDVIIYIKIFINNKWQEEWQNYPPHNKLREIKETVKAWKSSIQSKRHEEVVLARLRIGHTNITHSFLMCTPHEPPPFCNTCQVHLTVKHILVDCRNYNIFRNALFKSPSLTGILTENPNFSALIIFRFLKIYKLFDKI